MLLLPYLLAATGFDTAVILAAAGFGPSVAQFLDFMQIVTLLVGIPIVVFGAWNISRGHIQEGINGLVAGFLVCFAVPIIRLFASWQGVTI